MASVKVSDLFKDLNDWQDFYAFFHDYKLFGDLPDIFGRDESLDINSLHHIHLANTPEVQEKWAKTPRQFCRKTEIKHPEHDYWLIYAYDDFREEYLLLTITGPSAHRREKWDPYLRDILTTIVEPWTLGRVSYPEED
ncbi:type II toxin-antitoxin system YafO family toxin [Azotobacter beijerinckii]|uniref:Toxin YafO, type II toxin-antitoxin system n=1 Tax=Azotobacter beijerinckii TaxID=170623 RepID=A0A1I0ZXS8_9GAMM|nr:type II toxin-antitoxin system YafO family toxin [Azotobacter beijerinckii]SFB30347.1 Toxin YafO, type II toxin-antitoxin system [Azotobacter beijerinckii]